MPQYRVTEKSFINNALREPGEVIDFDGIPGRNLEPMDKAAQKAKDGVDPEALNAAAMARQKQAAAGVESQDLPGSKPAVDAPLA